MSLADQHTSTYTGAPEPPRRIFVSRNLRMDGIAAIGFDMDYTLARYRPEHFESLAYSLTIGKLLKRNYPEEIASLKYDPKFLIRGLAVDKQLGNILKLDRHGHASRVFHGRERVDKETRRQLYRTEKVSFNPPRFAMVDTLFSLPEICLYADLVSHFTRNKLPFDPSKLYDETREAIDEIHRDGSLKSIVREDIGRYVETDPNLARVLHKMRSSGKRLFLATNSYWEYTDSLMTHLLNGVVPEYADWKSYFEYILVGCRKPSFFTDENPFLEVDAEGRTSDQPAKSVERGVVYQGGNRQGLEQALGLRGEEILYVGDHIYGDILRSKKSTLWRTALVVEELEEEIQHSLDNQPLLDRSVKLEGRRQHLDTLANRLRSRLSSLEKRRETDAEAEREFQALKIERDEVKQELKACAEGLAKCDSELDEAFHPNWGMVFKDTRENSRFGEQVKNYACVYTSRVVNFLDYSTHQYFRSPRDLMPHERFAWDDDDQS